MKPFLIFSLVCLLMALVSDSAIIDSDLQKRFIGNPAKTENIMISFSKGIQTVIQQISKLNFTQTAEKRTALISAQQKFTKLVQLPLQKFLKNAGINFKSFWINNKIIIPNVSSRIVNIISKIPGIAKVEKEPVAMIDHFDLKIRNYSRVSRQQPAEWGIRKIRADQVWPQFKGKGDVVAGIDSGVRYTHEALKHNWRSNYGWYDPYENTEFPNDQSGHGTHTIGTIVGANGIGVAPEATWIACKACSTQTHCGASELYACGEWVLCPTKPDGSSKNCSMAPQIVSNSWAYSTGGGNWYDDVISSWQAAGIVPVFSIGNDGPSCNTVRSPGDRPQVIGVGSTDRYDKISTFSSLGPTSDGKTKPDISAPGSDVRSAWHTSDTAYNTISGTSMACQWLVSGLIALMLEKKPSLSYDQIFNEIRFGAERVNLNVNRTERVCGNKQSYFFPNNVFGHGRIDAMNTLQRIKI